MSKSRTDFSTAGINGGVSPAYNTAPSGKRDFRAKGKLQLVTPALAAAFHATFAMPDQQAKTSLGLKADRHSYYPPTYRGH